MKPLKGVRETLGMTGICQPKAKAAVQSWAVLSEAASREPHVCTGTARDVNGSQQGARVLAAGRRGHSKRSGGRPLSMVMVWSLSDQSELLFSFVEEHAGALRKRAHTRVSTHRHLPCSISCGSLEQGWDASTTEHIDLPEAGFWDPLQERDQGSLEKRLILGQWQEW